jgi:hypothetical protein
MRIR